MHDALVGKSVVIFHSRVPNDDDIAVVSKIVGQAGGAVTATVSLTPGVLRSQLRREIVSGELVHLPAGSRYTKLPHQGSQAGDLLGIALLSNVMPTVEQAQRDTVLAALREKPASPMHCKPATALGRQPPRWWSPAELLLQTPRTCGVSKPSVRRGAGAARVWHAACRPGRFGEPSAAVAVTYAPRHGGRNQHR